MIRCHLLKHLLQQIKVKKIKKGGRNYERGGIGKKAYEIIKGFREIINNELENSAGYVDEYIERLFEEIKKPYRHSQVSEISTYDERKRQFIAVMYDLYNPEIIKYVARATISKVMFYEEV